MTKQKGRTAVWPYNTSGYIYIYIYINIFIYIYIDIFIYPYPDPSWLKFT